MVPAANGPAESPPAGYRLRGELLWRELDGEWVVCTRANTSLVQLDGFTAAVLGLIEAGPTDGPALLQALAEAMGADAATGTGTGAAAAAADATLLTARLDEALRYLQAQDLVVTTAA